MGFSMQGCGPLTIIRKESYRECNFKESAGLSGYCGMGGTTSDTSYELIDKNGQSFYLGTDYGREDTGESSDSCTSQIRTKIHTKTWRVGASKISLTTVTEYQAESIKQPSL